MSDIYKTNELLLKDGMLDRMTPAQHATFAVLCANAGKPTPEFKRWADAWLAGVRDWDKWRDLCFGGDECSAFVAASTLATIGTKAPEKSWAEHHIREMAFSVASDSLYDIAPIYQQVIKS